MLRFLTNIGVLFDLDDSDQKQKIQEVVLAYQNLISTVLFGEPTTDDLVWKEIKISTKYYFGDRRPESVIELGNGTDLEQKNKSHYESKGYVVAPKQVPEDSSSKTTDALGVQKNDDWASNQQELNHAFGSNKGQRVLYDVNEQNEVIDQGISSGDEESSSDETGVKKGWSQGKILQFEGKIPKKYINCPNKEFNDSYFDIPFQVPYAKRQQMLTEIENNYRAYMEQSKKSNTLGPSLRSKQQSQSQTKTGTQNQTSSNKDSKSLQVFEKNESPTHLKKPIPPQQLLVIGSSAQQSQITPVFQNDAFSTQVDDQSLIQQRKVTPIFKFQGDLDTFFSNIADGVKERLESMYQSFKGRRKRARWMVDYFTENKPPHLYEKEFRKFMQYLNQFAHKCSNQVNKSVEDDLTDPPPSLLQEFGAIFALQSDSDDYITDEQQSLLKKETEYNDEVDNSEE